MSETISFQSVLNHLLDSQKDIPQTHLKLYSDLEPKSLRLFMDVWPSVKPARQLLLLDALLDHFDSENIVSYEEIGRALLNDGNGEVRARAIRLLSESDDPKLVGTLTSILLNDAELAPRLEAALLLGEFILMGELESIKAELQRKAEDALIAIIRSDEHPNLRKACLEALGYSSRPETAALIESAFERSDPTWTATALLAMGRSHDERWSEDVLSMLLDEDPLIQAAAAQAAGELSIQDAGPILLKLLLENEELDDDVVTASIWSLSQIGGDDARIYILNLIEQTEDEVLVEFLEDALENLDFTEELNKFDLLSLDADTDEDLEEIDLKNLKLDEDE